MSEFEAQLVILEVLSSKPLVTAGYRAVIHIHTAVEDCLLAELLSIVDKKTRKTSKRKPTFVRKGDLVNCKISLDTPICIERYSDYPQLGRFTLRDTGAF